MVFMVRGKETIKNIKFMDLRVEESERNV